MVVAWHTHSLREPLIFHGFLQHRARVELANGRRAAQGTCPVCGTKMNRILGKAKV